MASASIISIAAGMTPAPMIAETAAPACVGVLEGGEQGAAPPPASRVSRTVTSVAMPSVPSEPTTRPEQVVAGRVGRLAAELDHLARRA